MTALALALLRSFASDRGGLALAFVAPIAFFSLLAAFYMHLERPDGVRFPIAVIVESQESAADRLAQALHSREMGRVTIERIDSAREHPPTQSAFAGEIRIPSDFDPSAPMVIVASRWPLPGVADALKQMIAAAGASFAGGDATRTVHVVDQSSTGALMRAAVPGIVIMFILFALSANAGRGVGDDESGLGERLRSLGITAKGRLMARFATLGAIAFMQMAVMFAFAALCFGVVPGNLAALALAALLSALTCAAFVSALCELCVTRARFASISPIATLVLAGLGGSMVPIAILPDFLAAPSRWLFSGWSVTACHRALDGGFASNELLLLAATCALLLATAAALAQRNENR